MATGPEHYADAEMLLDQAFKFYMGDLSGESLAVAQGQAMVIAALAHAQLAAAAATVDSKRPHGPAWAQWDRLLTRRVDPTQVPE